MTYSDKLTQMINIDPRSYNIGLVSSFAFLILYLWSINNLRFSLTGFDISIRTNWLDLILRERADFIWESIGTIQVGLGELLISPLNIALGISLAYLVFLNIFTALFMYRMPKTCDVSPSGLLGVLPAALTGFACCAPTFLLALGPVASAIAAPFVTIRPFLIPASFILLTGGFFYLITDISPEHL